MRGRGVSPVGDSSESGLRSASGTLRGVVAGSAMMQGGVCVEDGGSVVMREMSRGVVVAPGTSAFVKVTWAEM